MDVVLEDISWGHLDLLHGENDKEEEEGVGREEGKSVSVRMREEKKAGRRVKEDESESERGIEGRKEGLTGKEEGQGVAKVCFAGTKS